MTITFRSVITCETIQPVNARVQPDLDQPPQMHPCGYLRCGKLPLDSGAGGPQAALREWLFQALTQLHVSAPGKAEKDD